MLENKKFVAWANENILVVVGHSEENHPTEIEDDKGKKEPGCPLYVGMTCEEHRAISRECMSPPEGIPAVKNTGRMPNTWLVSPSGEVTAFEPADQQSAGKIEEIIAEAQKGAGKHLTYKKYEKYRESFDEVDKALGESDLKGALKALKKVEKDTKKLPEGMVGEIDKRVESLNAKAVEAFEALKGGDDAVKAANKLKNDVGARLKRGYLPVVEDIKAWLKEAKAAAK